jgi:hypothetical protein
MSSEMQKSTIKITMCKCGEWAVGSVQGMENSSSDRIQTSRKTNFTATNTFRGRLMLTDQPEMNKRIGLMSVRVDFSAEQSRESAVPCQRQSCKRN